MVDFEETLFRCEQLEARLRERSSPLDLRGVHFNLVTVAAQLQGAVGELVRAQGETEATSQLERSLDELKARVRRVGLDLRVAPEAALIMGLELSLQSARDTIDRLQQLQE